MKKCKCCGRAESVAMIQIRRDPRRYEDPKPLRCCLKCDKVNLWPHLAHLGLEIA